MSIIIKIIGDNDGSDEYLAAEKLKKIIQSTAPSSAFGEVVLYPNATLFGMDVKDVDIMMIGHLQRAAVKVNYYEKDTFEEGMISIESFCTTIEVKSHPVRSIKREGTSFLVKYREGWHNVTVQSNKQKYSAKGFFDKYLGGSPFITNIIWFTEVFPEELGQLLSFDKKEIASNVLPSTFDFKSLAQLLVFQNKPYNKRLSCNLNRNTDDYVKPLLFFSKAKEGMGVLTRKRIEQITQKELSEHQIDIGERFTILRGKAGTGKTIDIIRTAINLVNEKDARVQILTYNRALVSDIRRLFALADLPDMFDEKCVSINTMQSYFFGLINSCLYNGNLSGDDFLKDYPLYLDEMIAFLKEDSSSRELVQLACEDNPNLNWDYILIDEGQDWSSKEQNLIFLLYDKTHLLVADGGQQYVRIVDPCDWSVVRERNNIKYKSCLRQKSNIIKFINHFARILDSSSNKIHASESMVGGRVIIIRDKNKLYDIVKRELKNVKKAGNIAYDMLFLTPLTLVKHEGSKSFVLKNEFENRGILLWDGTDDDKRLEYPVDSDESRILQYESCRGLEGWCVCCLDFDDYLRIKEEQYIPISNGNTLFLESAEDQRKRHLLNWALMPMTRAIDTLMLVLGDAESNYSKIILDEAKQFPDYVEIF